jgi:hypothetical protein
MMDIEEKETLLQYLVGTQLGATAQLMPKFHAELAGQGAECCWAQANPIIVKFQFCKSKSERTSSNWSRNEHVL